MGSHPLNLALRFALELAGLAALGYWGFSLESPWLAWGVGVALPVAAALVWAVFRPLVDPGPGRPIVTTPGPARLALEVVFFTGAAAALIGAEARELAIALGGVATLHYAASYDRVGALLRR